VEPKTTSEFQNSDNLQEYITTSRPEEGNDNNAKVKDFISKVGAPYTAESIAEIATTAPEVVESIEDFQQEEPEAQKSNQVSESTNDSQFLQLAGTSDVAERVMLIATTSNDDEKNASGPPDNNFAEENRKDPTVFSTSEEGVDNIIGGERSSLVVEETLSTAEPSELVTPAIVDELDETPSGVPNALTSDELKTVGIVAEAMSPNEEAVIQAIDDRSEETTSTEDNVVVLPESSESLEGSQTRSDAKDDTGLESANISDIHSTNSSSDATVESNGPIDTLSIAEPISVEQDVAVSTVLATNDEVTVIPAEDALPSLTKEASPDGENLLSLPDPSSAEKDTIAPTDMADPVVEEGSSTLAEEIIAVSEPSEALPPVVEEYDAVNPSVTAPEAESSEKSEVIDIATNEEVVPNESSEQNSLSSVKEHIPIEEVPEPRLDDELPAVIEGVATSVANPPPDEHVLAVLQIDERASPKQKSAAILETDNEFVAEEPSSLIADEISGISEHSKSPIPVLPEESNITISSIGGPDASSAESETNEIITNKDVVPDEEVGAGEIDDLPVHEHHALESHFVQETYPVQDGAHEPSKSLETDSVAEVKTDHEAQPFTNEPEPEFVVEGEAAAEVADSPVLTEPENSMPLSVTTGERIPEVVVESELTHLSEQGPATDTAEQTAVTIDEPEIPPTDEDVTVEAETMIQDNSVVVDQDMTTVDEDSVFVDEDIITDEADPVEVTETAKGLQEPLDVPEEETRLEQVADTEVSHPAPSQPTETKLEIIEDPVLDIDSKVEYAEAASLNGNGHHSVQPVTEKDKSVSEILQADESVDGAVVEEAASAVLQGKCSCYEYILHTPIAICT